MPYLCCSHATLFLLRACSQLVHQSLVQPKLERSFVEHVLFIRLPCDEAVHLDLIGLADTVCASLSLQVILRVPITVKDDYGISRGQVDAQSTSSSGKQHDETVHFWIGKPGDGGLTLGAYM